jgi:hypothetical protein
MRHDLSLEQLRERGDVSAASRLGRAVQVDPMLTLGWPCLDSVLAVESWMSWFPD